MTTSPRRLLAALVAALPIAGAAASFDCAKASTKIERAICADPKLDALDTALGQAYAALLASLDEPMKRHARDYQRAWLKQRDPRETRGLAQSLQERTAELRDARRTSGGVALLWLGGARRPPFVVTTLPGTAAYNAWAEQRWQEADADDAAALRVQAERDKCPPAADPDCTGEIRTHFFVLEAATPRWISVQADDVEDMGAAHPINTSTHHRAWLAKPGEVAASDLFADAEYRAVIGRHLRKFFDTTLGADRPPRAEADGDAARLACDPDNWGLTREGLRVTAQADDIALGHGFVEFVVPWAAFGKSLRPAFAATLRD